MGTVPRSSDLQLVPIRQLALFKEMQGVKDNKAERGRENQQNLGIESAAR